ncbi:DUF309 domain-containing protein [Metabacillus indicus]|uniref:DUF309 domain-containing protein n=1 Tax=Metabacillus indicus TaxID=246786 RepID=A0A084H0K1_METID|nr:DUF309 domain-containing protein [Metabacillus indicus]KEZ53113.1 hypothetical protein GS18_0209940 [Metabacillus indicus]
MYPKAYLDYLVHFHGDRDYFECHEVLEEHWKEDPPGKRKAYWVGLIQLSVGLYHYRRENWNGAERMIENAISICSQEKDALASLGLHPESLLELMRKTALAIEQKRPYESISLPVADEELLKQAKSHCIENGMTWGNPSNLADASLVHRHSARDRSDVIAERNRSLLQKKKNR